MKKILYSLSLLALGLFAGCEDYNDKHFDGLDDMTKPTHTPKLVYTLVEADYAAIADNSINKKLAKDLEATQPGSVKALEAVKTAFSFSSLISAQDFAPAFLMSKWYTMDNGASVVLTYDKTAAVPEYVMDFAAGDLYTLVLEDYKKAWGDKSELNFFTPSKPAMNYLPAILKAANADAVSGDYVYASYNESVKEPADITVAFKEDFEEATANENIKLENWSNVTVIGTFKWQAKSYGGNIYAQQSGFKHAAGELDSYLISKEITVEKGMTLSFDALYANTKDGGRMKVLVSTDLTDTTSQAIAAATWGDLTGKFTIPESPNNSGDLENAGVVALADYVGKKVRIAFRYQGDNVTATTTIRIDNVTVSTPGKNVYSVVNKLYSYNGTVWNEYTKSDIRVLSQADFVEMGSKYDNFSSTMNADDYLPTFLNQKYPYALNDDVLAVAYKYYASSETTIFVDEYIRANGAWKKNNFRTTVTDQFVFSTGKWSFDPSTTVQLKAKGDVETAAFYQTLTNWVKANKGAEYVTSYGNNDYYYGGSAFNNNFDFRPSAWKKQYAGYESMSDDELSALMFKRLPEAFVPALAITYPTANVVPGVKVIYTVNFLVFFDGFVTKPYTIQYEVTGKAEFTYIADSLQEVK